MTLLAQADQTTLLSVAGGIIRNNAKGYSRAGVNLFITSAPYYAASVGINMIITPL